jgi:hypothetical protein
MFDCFPLSQLVNFHFLKFSRISSVVFFCDFGPLKISFSLLSSHYLFIPSLMSGGFLILISLVTLILFLFNILLLLEVNKHYNKEKLLTFHNPVETVLFF